MDWLTIGCDPIHKDIGIFLSKSEEIALEKIGLLENDDEYKYFLFQTFWVYTHDVVESMLSFLRNCGIPKDHAIRILDEICEMLSGK